MRTLERAVLGCDYGGTSWTTKSQADRIPSVLGLAKDSHLLEIGAGSGWPGVYLATLTPCKITLLDIPVSALKHARQRAVEEKVANNCRAVAASGAALPFAQNTFRAISHSDVLCCLPEKVAMLIECRRVAKDGANMLFYVIAPESGLSDADLDRACKVGPPFVAVADDYDELLGESGWHLLEKSDLTGDYLEALKRLVCGLETGADQFEEVLGPEEFEEHLAHRRSQIGAIELGLLKREMFVARTN